MSVLIMGLKMQKEEALKIAIRDGIASVYLDEGKADYYSVIELPDHGDLIDKDALVDKAEFIGDAFSGRGGFAVWATDVVNAPVIIPAERSEE